MKKRFTESLDERLLKYSLVAGTLLIASKQANAQVWGTSVNRNISNSSYTISFNGNAKFLIREKNSSAPLPPPYSGNLITGHGYIKPMTSNAGWINSGIHPKALGSGYVVNSGENFHQGNTNSVQFFQVKQYFYRTFTKNRTFFSSGINFWQVDKYIGAKFQISGSTYYGWIKITVNTQGPPLIIVKSFAYEQTSGTSITANGVLPVELTSFTANSIGNKVELNWHTATEVNNYGFGIERSRKAEVSSLPAGQASQNSNWEQIGFVKGNGNSNSPEDYSFVDTNPVSGEVEYRLKQIDNDGAFKYSSIVTVNSLPAKFALFQNYPNPFNPATTIKYSIPKAEHVTLKVYDELGNEVSTLVDENKEAGIYEVQFNRQQTTDNKQLASGIYFYRITAGDFTDVKKLMLLK